MDARRVHETGQINVRHMEVVHVVLRLAALTVL
jgi:hypothetical protein